MVSLRSTITPLLACLALLTGCASTAENPAAPSDGNSREDELDEKRHELEKKERELALARLEFELARAKAEARLAERAATLAQAEFDVEAASAALEHYREREVPQRVAQERLGVDTARFRLEEERAKQEQMEAEYGPHLTDEQARKTGEIVLERGRTFIGFAERRLELAQRELASLEEHELPRKLAELERALEKEQEDLASKRRDEEHALEAARIAVMREENQIASLEIEVRKLRAKLEKAADGDSDGDSDGGHADHGDSEEDAD